MDFITFQLLSYYQEISLKIRFRTKRAIILRNSFVTNQNRNESIETKLLIIAIKNSYGVLKCWPKLGCWSKWMTELLDDGNGRAKLKDLSFFE